MAENNGGEKIQIIDRKKGLCEQGTIYVPSIFATLIFITLSPTFPVGFQILTRVYLSGQNIGWDPKCILKSTSGWFNL